MGALETVFTSILSGGATGLFGIIVQRWADLRNKKLDLQANREKMDHEVRLRQVDAEIMAQEWAARTQMADIEAAGREAVADAQAFASSFNEPVRYSENVQPSKGQGWMLVVLDFIRGIVRPGLTVYLCAVTTLVYIHARDILASEGIALSSDQAMDLMKLIVGTILYLTTTCVLWWFGTRNKQAPPQIKR